MGVSVGRSSTGKLRLRAKVGEVPPEAVSLAQAHKAELAELLSQSCSPHNKPENYLYSPAPNRPGWLKGTCRVCGRFIGYIPASLRKEITTDPE